MHADIEQVIREEQLQRVKDIERQHREVWETERRRAEAEWGLGDGLPSAKDSKGERDGGPVKIFV
jgi:hypothetical protein